jgi:hypothetical protein
MRSTSELSAQRVDPGVQTPDGVDRFDYADAFEIRLPTPDERTAEEWMRSALDEAPGPVHGTIRVAHRFVLGFHLEPRSAPGNLMGWPVVSSVPDLIHLRATSPLMRGDLVVRRDGPMGTTLVTYLSFNRPRAGRLIWMAVGPVHRRIAPYLLERAAAGKATSRLDGTRRQGHTGG